MNLLGKWRRAKLGRVPMDILEKMQSDGSTAIYLKNIFLTVVEYFRVTLEDSRFDVLVPRLNAVEPELRGFAYEGAGMGLMLLDIIFPWKKRLRAFLAGPGSPYTYPVYVGMGLVLARLGKRPEPYLLRLDPVISWFAIDGYGFRAGFFDYSRTIEQQEVPAYLSFYALRLFDQGIGRSLWFSTGANIDRIVTSISLFPRERQVNQWCGVGFACAYAGGVDRSIIETLRTVAVDSRLSLARGAAVAAKARQRAGNLVPHTNMACEVLCGLSSHMAAQLTDVALQDIPTDSTQPPYEIWQRRIEAELAASAERAIKREPRFAQ